jgi:hypothetical protein
MSDCERPGAPARKSSVLVRVVGMVLLRLVRQL